MVQVRFLMDEIFRLLLDVWMLQFFLVSGHVLEISDLLLFRFDHIEKKLDYVQIILGYPSQNADVVYVTDVCESDDGQTCVFPPEWLLYVDGASLFVNPMMDIWHQ